MKKAQLIFFFILCFVKISNSQNWQWATSAGGFSSDLGGNICTDQLGNYYNSIFSTSASCYFQTDTFNINGRNDFFIVKHDVNGNEVWIKQFGGPNTSSTDPKSEGISDLIYDAVNNCLYATGEFYETCQFGSITLTTNTNDLCIFLAKFDLNGNCLWAVKSGSNNDDSAYKLTTDPAGDIYLSGSVTSTGHFDTLTVPTGGFLAKYDSNGNLKWVKNISGYKLPLNSAKYPVGVMFFSFDKLYMYGVALDSLTIDTISFTLPNYRAQILSAWDTSGNVQWAKQFAGPMLTYPGGCSSDSNGDIYLTGRFSGTHAIFDADTLFSTDPVCSFIAKYDKNGNKILFKPINSSQDIYCTGTSSDINGNVYVTGAFVGDAIFKANNGTYDLVANASKDMFVARFNKNIDCLGVRHAGEAIGENVISTLDGAVVIGEFQNTITFDSYSLTSSGFRDVFLAKIGVITGTGEVGDRSGNNQLIIYSNPTQGKCNIKIPEEFLNDKNLILSVYNNVGKLIQQKAMEVNDGKIKLNMEAEAKGIYTVTLSNKNKVYSGKVIFE